MFETPVKIQFKNGRIRHAVMSAINDPEMVFIVDYNNINEYQKTTNKELIEMINIQSISTIEMHLK
jgi:hypothetical protein